MRYNDEDLCFVFVFLLLFFLLIINDQDEECSLLKENSKIFSKCSIISNTYQKVVMHKTVRNY